MLCLRIMKAAVSEASEYFQRFFSQQLIFRTFPLFQRAFLSGSFRVQLKLLFQTDLFHSYSPHTPEPFSLFFSNLFYSTLSAAEQVLARGEEDRVHFSGH